MCDMFRQFPFKKKYTHVICEPILFRSRIYLRIWIATSDELDETPRVYHRASDGCFAEVIRFHFFFDLHHDVSRQSIRGCRWATHQETPDLAPYGTDGGFAFTTIPQFVQITIQVRAVDF